MTSATSSMPPEPMALQLLLGSTYDVADLSDVAVQDVTLDSRMVSVGSLFCAVPGEVSDGRDFIQQAIDSGAAAVLCESPLPADKTYAGVTPVLEVEHLKEKLGSIAARFFHDPSSKMNVVGVTGTNGKTTCVFLLAQAFQMLGQKSALLGTLGIGSPDALFSRNLTTGDAVQLQKDFYKLDCDGFNTVCMEVSSHGLHQGRVNGSDIDVAVFTNLSQDHLDYHGTMEAYGQAKEKLFCFESLDVAVINLDDDYASNMIAVNQAKNLITFGLSSGDVFCSDLVCDIHGIRLNLHYQSEYVALKSKLLGQINVPNLLATAATLLASNTPLHDVANVISTLSPPAGRMEQFVDNQDITIVVDYSHTPDSLARALQSLRTLTQGKLWCVFGCGGDRDNSKRPLMGEYAERLSDHVIVTNDNPRSEDPLEIIRQICTKMQRKPIVLPDRFDAIAYAYHHAASGDVILVAGKGHEETQTVGNEKHVFSDRAVAADLIGGAK